MRIVHFLSYHNAVPVGFSILLLGAGGVFAASEPDMIYSTSSTVVSIDNTYLVNINLASYSPRVTITGVTEDSEYYYLAYNFFTIDLVDGVWRDTSKQLTMNVSKVDLGATRDLGLYVTEQLKQKTDRELAYLKEVQDIEKKNVSHKVVATEYGGLVGRMLDTRTEELPGYTPVIAPPPVVVAAEDQNVPPDATPAESVPAHTDATVTLQILGNNPAVIPLDSQYSDLGAVATDRSSSSMSVSVYVDGRKVDYVSIDTSVVGEHVLRYEAFDSERRMVSAERIVRVFDPYAVEEPVEPSPEAPEDTAPTVPEVSPQPDPEPEQEQEPEPETTPVESDTIPDSDS